MKTSVTEQLAHARGKYNADLLAVLNIDAGRQIAQRIEGTGAVTALISPVYERRERSADPTDDLSARGPITHYCRRTVWQDTGWRQFQPAAYLSDVSCSEPVIIATFIGLQCLNAKVVLPAYPSMMDHRDADVMRTCRRYGLPEWTHWMPMALPPFVMEFLKIAQGVEQIEDFLGIERDKTGAVEP